MGGTTAPKAVSLAMPARMAGRMSGSLEGGERTVEEPGDRRRLLEEGVVPIGRFEQVERLRPTESRAEQLELPEGDQGVAGHGDEGDRRGDSRRVHRVQIERLGELTTRSEERRVGKECRSRW